MSTPLTDGINALTQYANEVTGASDTNLSDAVYTLAQGYGGGSTPTGMSISLITKPYNSTWSVTNDLGEVPDTIVLIPVNTPSGTGQDYPHIIIGLSTLNNYGYTNYHGMMKLWENSSGKTDYTQNIGGWDADESSINFTGNTNSISPQDYILIAYKYQ